MLRKIGVTLNDVARQAGVSSACVSAVLSDNPSKNIRVSETTRQHVIEVAQRIRYQPNVMARSLQQRHTNIVGFYGGPQFLLDAHHPVSAAMLGGIQTGCMNTGRNLLLYGGFHQRSEESIFAELENGHVDGLIV